jgi:hypothetical protein
VSRISYRKQINGPWVLKEDDDINEDGNNGDQVAPAEEDNGINEDGYNENGNNDGQGPPAEDNDINEDGNQEQHVAAEEYNWWNSDEDDYVDIEEGDEISWWHLHPRIPSFQ